MSLEWRLAIELARLRSDYCEGGPGCTQCERLAWERATGEVCPDEDFE